MELIDKAYSSGNISRGEKIFYNVQAIFAPQNLPSEFQSASPSVIRSGTPFVNEALDNWAILTPEQQALVSGYLTRPSNELEYISGESHFAIHYDTSGYDSVPLEDLNSNDIPDYVERIGLYSDSCYRHYQYNLEYYPPPMDGDSLYDIYLVNMPYAYGLTVKEDPGDSAWDDFSSYIQINSTLNIAQPNHDPEGTVIGAQKITCAHEYYHATQLAYSYEPSPNLWWTEGTAVFFEDEVYDEADNHYSFLPDFFNYPDTSLIDSSPSGLGYHSYSTFIWPSFLSEKFGIDILKKIWEYIRYSDPLPSIDSALGLFSEEMTTVFPEFTVWNYFTESRADTAYHDDGANYPLIMIDQTVSSCPFTGIYPNNAPDGLASNYIVAYPDTSQIGLLLLKFEGSSSVRWAFSYVCMDDDIAAVVGECEVNVQGNTDCGIYDFSRYDSVTFIPCVVSQWHDDNYYEFNTEVHPLGDADGSGEVNLLDLTYIIKYLYKGGSPPKYDDLMGDGDCNGTINILDVSYLIYYLYRSGPPPCSYRP